MNIRIRKLGIMLMLLAVVFSNGLQLAVFQGIAWSRMFTEYQKIMPAQDALALTLSGEEVCGLCKSVRAMSQELESDWLFFFSGGALLILLSTVFPALMRSLSKRIGYQFVQLYGAVLSKKVPIAPPRFA